MLPFPRQFYVAYFLAHIFTASKTEVSQQIGLPSKISLLLSYRLPSFVQFPGCLGRHKENSFPIFFVQMGLSPTQTTTPFRLTDGNSSFSKNFVSRTRLFRRRRTRYNLTLIILPCKYKLTSIAPLILDFPVTVNIVSSLCSSFTPLFCNSIAKFSLIRHASDLPNLVSSNLGPLFQQKKISQHTFLPFHILRCV